MPNEKNVNLETLIKFAEAADKRLDVVEKNMPLRQALTLSQSGWTNDSGDTEYPYKYTLAVSGVTASSRADIVLDSDSVIVATACGLCNVTDTDTDSVILKSRTIPEADLTGYLYVTRETVESSS